MRAISIVGSLPRQDQRTPFCLMAENVEDLIDMAALQNRRIYCRPYRRILTCTPKATALKAAQSRGTMRHEDRAKVMHAAKALYETGLAGVCFDKARVIGQ